MEVNGFLQTPQARLHIPKNDRAVEDRLQLSTRPPVFVSRSQTKLAAERAPVVFLSHAPTFPVPVHLKQLLL